MDATKENKNMRGFFYLMLFIFSIISIVMLCSFYNADNEQRFCNSVGYNYYQPIVPPTDNAVECCIIENNITRCEGFSLEH